MRKNRLISVIIAIVSVFCFGTLFACGSAKSSSSGSSKVTVTYSYNYEGAPGNGVYKTESVEKGSTLSKPTDPVRADYSFDYWTTDEGGNHVWNFSTAVSSTMTLYAQWTADSVISVTSLELTPPDKTVYDVGDELDMSGAVVSVTYSDGHTADIDVSHCTVTGFDSTAAGEKTVTVSYGGKSKTFTVTVSAEALSEYTVYYYYNYDGAPGSGLFTTATVKQGNRPPKPAESPVREGWGFKYWSADELGDEEYAFTQPIGANLELYAAWKRNAPVLTGLQVTPPDKTTYNVGETLDKTGLVVKATYDYGNPKTLSEGEGGYTLDIPLFDTAGKKQVFVNYAEGEVSKQGTFDVTVNEVVPVSHTVTFYYNTTADPEAGVSVQKPVEPGQPVSELSPEPSRDGYRFTGWYTKKECAPADAYVFTTVVESDLSLYAGWERNAPVLAGLTVTGPTKLDYDIDEEFDKTGLVVKATYDYGEPKTLAEGESGYTLSVPSFATAGPKTVTVSYTEGDVTKTKDITVTVHQAAASTYTVTFYLNYTQDSMDVFATAPGIEKDASVTEPDPAPGRPGYRFTGWYTDRDSAVPYVFTTGVTANLSLYAGWQKNAAVLQSITVSPKKTTYIVGQHIVAADLTVTAHYDDPTADREVAFADLNIVEPNMATEGANREVTVSYTEGEVTKERTYTITVIARAVARLELDADKVLSKTSYFVGENFDPTGLSFTAVYNDDTTVTNAAVTYSATGLVDGKFTVDAASLTVTASYEGVACATAFTVSVQKVEVVSLTVSGALTTATFNKGDDFDPAGLIFTVKYNNSDETHPAASEVTFTGDGLTNGKLVKSGTVSITASYDGVVALTPITVTVNVPQLTQGGWYLVGSVNNNGADTNTGEYAVTATSYEGGKTVYKSGYITLKANDTFKLGKFTDSTKVGAEQFSDWKTVSADKITVDPVTALLSVSVNASGYVKIDSIDAGVKSRGWVITYTEANGAIELNITLDYVDTRDPVTGAHASLAAGAGTNEVYLAGNFADNFAFIDAWSSGNSAIAYVDTTPAHKVYYFTNVHLNRYDSFKLYVPGRGVDGENDMRWLGGTFVAVETKISVSAAEGAPNIYLGTLADGQYNLVFDTADDSLTIYPYKAITVDVTGEVYETAVPQKTALSVVYDGAPLSNALYTLYAPAAVKGELMSTLTVIYKGTVAVKKYTATNLAITGIYVSRLPSKYDYYVCETVSKSDITVMARYNYGEDKPVDANDFAISAYTASDYAGVAAVENKLTGYYTTTVTVSLVADATKTCDITGIRLYNHAKSISATAVDKVFYAGATVTASDVVAYIVFNEDEEHAENVRMPIATGLTVENKAVVAGANVFEVSYVVSDDPVTTTPYTIRGTVAIQGTAVIPSALTFTTPATKPVYRSGTTFDGNGYTFTVSYNNNTSKTVQVNELILSGAKIGADGKFVEVDELTENVSISVSYKEGDITVTADYDIVIDLDVPGEREYTVRYYTGLDQAYSVTGMPAQVTINVRADAEAITLPSAPAAKGFNFVCWKENNTTNLNINEGYKVVGDVDIYASWTAKSYTVTYNAYGGGHTNPTTYTAKGLTYEVVALNSATLAYHNAGVWYTQKTGGTKVEALSYAALPETGTEIVLHAQYTAITYTLQYVMGDYGDAIGDATFTAAEIAGVATLPGVTINTIGRNGGWRFDGWYTAKEGGKEVPAITTDMLDGLVGTIVKVYATYDNHYTVTFDPNDGALAPATVNPASVVYDRAVEEPATPVRSGYEFTGWHLVTDGVAAAEVYDFTAPVHGDITLVASWHDNPKDGTFLRITSDNWSTYRRYKADAHGTDGDSNGNNTEYKLTGLSLKAGDIFYLTTYDKNGNEVANEPNVKPRAENIGSYSKPTGAITIGTISDSYGGYNYKVTNVANGYADATWTLYVSKAMTSADIEPSTSSHTPLSGDAATLTHADPANAAVYIRGSFTDNYATVDDWSSVSTVIPTAVSGGKYWFGNVHLNKFDGIKIFVTALGEEDGWLGGNYGELGQKIALSDSHTAPNVLFLGESGKYDILFDYSATTSPALYIYAHKQLSATLAAGVTLYEGQTPKAADFAFTYDGEEVSSADVALVSPAAAAAGANTVTARYGNTVAFITYTAVAEVTADIEIITDGNFKSDYNIGEAFATAGLTVELVYNSGRRVELEMSAVDGYTVGAMPQKATVADNFNDRQSVTVDISAFGYTKQVNITVKNVFIGIEVKAPTKTEYYQGNTFVSTGMQVTAVFNHATDPDSRVTSVVSSGYSYEPDMTTVGTHPVEVTYREKTAQFNITINQLVLEGITVAPSSVSDYKPGDAFDPSAMTVTATYNDAETTKTPQLGAADCTVAFVADVYDTVNNRFLKSGSHTATVSYTEGSVTKTATFTVVVSPLTVTYELAGGTLEDGISAAASVTEYGALITPPTAAQITRDHYDFTGWYLVTNGVAATDAFDPATPVTGDITLRAGWDGVTYNVTFNYNYTGVGAPAPTIVPVKYIGEQTRVQRPDRDPDRDGYNFHCWSETAENDGDEFDFNTVIDRDIVLYANWTQLATFEVVFKDGEAVLHTYSIIVGRKVTRPDDPTKTGYKFAGWLTKANTTFDFDTPIDRPYELHADWTVESYKLSFDANGGAPTPAERDVDYNDTVAAVTAPEKTGYTFAGWWYTPEGETEAVEWVFGATGTKMPDGAVALTAKWNKNSYSLVYNADGGAPTPAADSVEYGATVSAPDAPQKTGYTFAGWWYTPTGETEAVEWVFDEEGTAMPAGAVTLKAKWNINSYTLRFVSDGVNVVEPVSKQYNAKIEAPTVTLNKLGHEFGVWLYTNDSGVEEVYTFTQNSSMPARDLIFTAKWNVLKYTLTFVDGNTTVKTVNDVAFGSDITAHKPIDPTKACYEFAYWKKGNDEWSFATDTMPAGNLELVAHYTAIEYTLVYNVDGKTQPITSVSFTVETIATAVLPVIAKEDIVTTGYYFTGWTLGKGGSSIEEITESFLAERTNRTITVLANYDNRYTVTFNLNYTASDRPADPTARVEYGQKTTPPTGYTRANYILSGWYTDADCHPDHEFVFTTNTVTEDITLYAWWVANVSDGIYLLGDFETDEQYQWQKIFEDSNRAAKYIMAETGENTGVYRITGLTLKAGQQFKIVSYSNKVVEWTAFWQNDQFNGRLNPVPAGLITVTNGANLSVSTVSSGVTSWELRLVVKSEGNQLVIMPTNYNQSRDPRDPDQRIDVTSNEPANMPASGAYILGNFTGNGTDGFKVAQRWSSNSSVASSADGVYYFTDVYLKKYDTFKVYYDGQWLGTGAVSVTLGTPIDLANRVNNEDAPNIYLSSITDGRYNIKVDFTDNKKQVTIYPYEELTASHGVIYDGHTPAAADFTVKKGGVALAATEWSVYGEWAAADIQGANTVQVLYKGGVYTFEYQVTAVAAASITVRTEPNKKTYVVGEQFNTAGLSVNIVNNDGSHAVATADGLVVSAIPVAAAGSDGDRLGAYNVELTITLAGTEVSTTYTVKVSNVLSRIAVTTLPTQTTYVQNNNVDYSGMVITAYFNDDHTAAQCSMVIPASVEGSDGYTVSPEAGSKLTTTGINKVTVTCRTKTAEFDIQVNEPRVKAVKVEGTANAYKVGDVFTGTDSGLTFTATYDNDETGVIPASDMSFDWTGKNGRAYFTAAGTVVVTPSYAGHNGIDGAIPVTGTISVTVSDKLTSVAVSKQSSAGHTNTANWVVGDAFTTTGMELTLTYNQNIIGAEEAVRSESGINTGFTVAVNDDATDMLLHTASNSYRITVTYGGVTGSFNIVVEEVTVKLVAATGAPTKTSYYVGDKFEPGTGISYLATYNNDTTGALGVGGMTFDWTNKNVSGQFTKKGAETVKTYYGLIEVSGGEYTVTVADKLTSIAVATAPTAPHAAGWVEGDRVRLTGMELALTYNQEITGATSYTAEQRLSYADAIADQFSWDLTDDLEVGNDQTVTVTYAGLSATFDINVVAKVMTGFAVSVTGTVNNQYYDRTFDITGYTFTVSYNNDTTKSVTTGITFVSAGKIDNNKFTDYGSGITVVAEYTEGGVTKQTGEFTVNVIDTHDYFATFVVNAPAGLANDVTNMPTRQQIPANNYATEPAAPSLTGYTFGGWYKEPACTNAWGFKADAITADTNIYAKWTANSYVVRYVYDTTLPVTNTNPTAYNANDVSNVFDPVGLTNFDIDHYIFGGWYREQTYQNRVTALTYSLLQYATVEDDDGTSVNAITLYAKIEGRVYNVTFSHRNGTTDKTETTVTYPGTVENKAPNVSYKGYTPDGWFYLLEGVETEWTLTDIVTGDLELYAKWSAREYTVALEPNGGTVEGGNTFTVLYTQVGTKALPVPAKEGYTFKGWYVDPEFGGLPVTALTLDDFAEPNFAKVYAKWQIKTYTVSFNANGGTLAAGTVNAVVSYGGKLTAPAAPELTGYTFAGWFTAAEDGAEITCGDSGVVFNNANITTATAAGDDYALALYAQWQINKYTLVFEDHDGTVIDTIEEVTFGSDITDHKPADPKRDFYTFACWNNGNAVWNFDADTMPASDLTLTATYNAVVYRIEFDMNGKGEDVTTKVFTITELAANATLPVADEITITAAGGWYFTGWYTAAQNGDPIEVIDEGYLKTFAAVDNSVTIILYADYDNHYTVTFELEGGRIMVNEAEYEEYSASVVYNTAVTQPADPTRASFTFGDWYLVENDELADTPYNFDTRVIGNITLRATWTANPQDGWYLCGTMNAWGSSKTDIYQAVYDEDKGEYKITDVKLKKDDQFLVGEYNSEGVQVTWIKAHSDQTSGSTKLRSYCAPEGMVVIGAADKADGNGRNYLVTEYPEELEGKLWTIYVSRTMTSLHLQPDNTPRSVSGDRLTAPAYAEDVVKGELYIRGNFTGGFRPLDEWSTVSSTTPAVKVGSKYYISNVHLKPFDQFKLFIPTDAPAGEERGIDTGLWLSGKFEHVGTPFKLNGTQDIYLLDNIEEGDYDLVYDSTESVNTLTIFVHKALTGTVASGKSIYVGHTPALSDFTFMYGTDAATGVTLVKAEPAAGSSSTILAVCDNTAAYITYTPTALVAQSIAVTSAPATAVYHVGDTFDKTGMVVTVTYNSGDTESVEFTVSSLPSSVSVDNYLTDGAPVTLNVYATVGGKQLTTTVNVTVYNKLTSITVAAADPTKTYYTGDAFSQSDLIVTAVYNEVEGGERLTQVVTTGITLSAVDMDVAEEQKSVTVSYGGKTATYKFAVTQLALAGITTDAPAAGIDGYRIGDAFSMSGVTVTATYNDPKATKQVAATVAFDAAVYDAVNCRFLTAGTHTGTVTYTEGGVTKTTTLKAVVSGITVSFVTNGGTEVLPVTYNNYADTINVTTGKEHYTFLSWHKDEELKTAAVTAVSAAIPATGTTVTLYANWQPETYRITEYSFGNTGENTYSASFKAGVTLGYSYVYGEGITLPGADDIEIINKHEYNKYSFFGWMVEGETEHVDMTAVSGNIKLVADIRAATVYTFTFNLNYTGSTAITKNVAENYTAAGLQNNTDVVAATAARTGYTFAGWYTTATEQVTEYVFSTPVTQATTVYAKWNVNKHTVTFKDGETTLKTEEEVAYGSDVKALAPTVGQKTGYTFGGWTKSTGGEWNGTDDLAMPDCNLVLTAVWNVNEYTLTFVNEDETVIKTVTKVAYGSAITDHKPADPSKDFYTFASWKNGNAVWDFATDTMPADNLTLTAAYTAITYTITFDMDGKATQVSARTFTKATMTATTLTLPLPTEVTINEVGLAGGWKFTGWKRNNAAVTAITEADLKALTVTDNAATITVKAQYDNHYTVSFSLNYVGAETVPSQTVEYGQKVTEPKKDGNAYTRENYLLGGWFTSAECKQNEEFDFANTTVTSNMTLYAQWNADVKDGIYVLGNFEDSTHQWGDVFKANELAAKYRMVETSTGSNVYRVVDISLSSATQFKIVNYTNGKIIWTDWHPESTGRKFNGSVKGSPSALVTVTRDDAENIKITKADASVTKWEMQLVVKAGGNELVVMPSLYNFSRTPGNTDPDVHPTVSGTDPTTGVYIRGNFTGNGTEGFKVTDLWSSKNNEVVSVSGSVYYFTKVYLKQNDSFKVYICDNATGSKWFGVSSTTVAVNTEVTLNNSDGNHDLLLSAIPAEGSYYNIKIDLSGTNKKLIIYPYEELTVEHTTVYDGHKPIKDDFTVKKDGAALAASAWEVFGDGWNTDAQVGNANTVQVLYKGGVYTFNYTGTAIAPASIAVKAGTAPAKTTYYVGDSVSAANLAGLVITVTNNDGSHYDIEDLDGLTLPTSIVTAVAGTEQDRFAATTESLTVALGALTTTFNVSVFNKVTSITVAGPTNREIIENQAVSFAGLVVYANFNGGTSVRQEVTTYTTTNKANDSAITSGTVLTAVGTTTVVVTYTGDHAAAALTGEFTITVSQKSLTALAITDATSVKKAYYVGDTFDPAGMVVTATYDNGDEETFTGTLNFVNADAFNSSKQFKAESTGEGFVLTVQDYNGIAVTGTVTVTVKDKLTSVAVTTPPIIREGGWVEGDIFALTGMVVTAKYNEGVTDAAVKSVTGIDAGFTAYVETGVVTIGTRLTTADTAYKFTYTDGEGRAVVGVGTITVAALAPASLTVSGTVAEQYVGSGFNMSGLTFTLNYNNGTTESDFDSNAFTVSGTTYSNNKFTSSGTGVSVTVTHTASGKSCTVTGITVTNATKYTVSFSTGNGGSTVDAQSVGEDEDFKATRPAPPTRRGYTFDTWLLNGAEYSFNTVVSGDIELVAKWNAIDYTVTYVISEDVTDTVTNTNSTQYKVNASNVFADVTLSNATADHYDFVGWYKSTTFTDANKVTKLEYSSLELADEHNNITLYAYFTPKKYTVQFVTGSNDTINARTVVYNTFVNSDTTTLANGNPANEVSVPRKTQTDDTQFEFEGWYVTEDGTVTDTKWDLDSDLVTGDLKLTAKYTEYYKVTYVVGSGTPALEPKWVKSGETAPEPTEDDVAWADHKLVGWTKNGASYDFATEVTGAITLTAVWKELFDVTFNANLPADHLGTAGTVPATIANVVDGTDRSLSGKTMTDLTSHTFVGWNTDSSAITALTNVTVDSDKTLYAVWQAKEVTITFNPNSGTLTGGATQKFAYGGTVGTGAIGAEPTRTGYGFDGWFTDATDGNEVTASTAFAPDSMSVTLFAHWTPNVVLVTFNANGGTVDPANTTVDYGSKIAEADLPTPVRTGYNFAGWFKATDGTAQITKDTAITTATVTMNADADATTLYAHWTMKDGVWKETGTDTYEFIGELTVNPSKTTEKMRTGMILGDTAVLRISNGGALKSTININSSSIVRTSVHSSGKITLPAGIYDFYYTFGDANSLYIGGTVTEMNPGLTYEKSDKWDDKTNGSNESGGYLIGSFVEKNNSFVWDYGYKMTRNSSYHYILTVYLHKGDEFIIRVNGNNGKDYYFKDISSKPTQIARGALNHTKDGVKYYKIMANADGYYSFDQWWSNNTSGGGLNITYTAATKVADFTEDFREDNTANGWWYGVTGYSWEGGEHFSSVKECDTYNTATWTNSTVADVEIKQGWVRNENTNSNSYGACATIAYTPAAAGNYAVNVSFVGSSSNTRIAARVIVRKSDGTFRSTAFINLGQSSSKWTSCTNVSVSAGDTVYLVLFNEQKDESNAGYYHGALNMSLFSK